MLQHQTAILPPSIPDYVLLDNKKVGQRQDGLNLGDTSNQLPIGEMNEQQANEYADLFKTLFMDKWKASQK